MVVYILAGIMALLLAFMQTTAQAAYNRESFNIRTFVGMSAIVLVIFMAACAVSASLGWFVVFSSLMHLLQTFIKINAVHAAFSGNLDYKNAFVLTLGVLEEQRLEKKGHRQKVYVYN